MNIVTPSIEPVMPDLDIMQRLRSRYVSTGDDAALKEHFNRVLVARDDGSLTLEPLRYGSESEGDTRGIIVTAPPGAGKTRLVGAALDQILAEAGPCPEQADDMQPILRVTVPSPATLKSLGLELLEATGYRATGVRQERWHIWSTVRHRLGVVGVKVVWLPGRA